MKKDRLHGFGLAVLLLSMLLLTACGASAADTGGTGSDDLQQTEGTASQQEDATLEDLLGEDYVTYVTETITMQMGNRMEKDPEQSFQQILGSCIPLNLDNILRPPMEVRSMTFPGSSSVTVPIRAAFSPSGIARMAAISASARSGSQTMSIRPSQAQ